EPAVLATVPDGSAVNRTGSSSTLSVCQLPDRPGLMVDTNAGNTRVPAAQDRSSGAVNVTVEPTMLSISRTSNVLDDENSITSPPTEKLRCAVSNCAVKSPAEAGAVSFAASGHTGIA